jgi:hydroxyacylglutathione hydrolase
MLKIKSFTFNPFYENTYILYDDSLAAIVVDPGCYDTHEQAELDHFIALNALKVQSVVLTHAHIDHVLGAAYVKRKYNVPLIMHELDVPTLRSVAVYAPNYGFAAFESVTPEQFVQEGDTIALGQEELAVLFVPGHAPGHIALVHQEQKICIAGDVLFQRSIGRTDLPGGDYDTLIRSIRTKLFNLSDDTVVYCGHGPSTTIGDEKRHNPFCAI